MSFKIKSLIVSDKDVASYEKKLSICISPNGFSFSVIDVFDELLALGDVECDINAHLGDLLSDIKGVLAEAGLVTFGLKESELVMTSRQIVWVPQHLYDAGRRKDYLDAICNVATGFDVFDDYNDLIKAHLVFSADAGIVSAFKVAVPGIKIRCQHSKMVNATMMENSDMRSLMLVNIREGETDFAVFNNKKLQLSNTFRCANYDETMYYALNLSKQFHLEDARTIVAVCGNVDRDGFALMRGYFPNVVLYTGKPLTLTVPEMQHIHTYRYALILS